VENFVKEIVKIRSNLEKKLGTLASEDDQAPAGLLYNSDTLEKVKAAEDALVDDIKDVRPTPDSAEIMAKFNTNYGNLNRRLHPSNLDNPLVTPDRTQAGRIRAEIEVLNEFIKRMPPIQDSGEPKELRDSRELREPRDSRELREPRDSRDSREACQLIFDDIVKATRRHPADVSKWHDSMTARVHAIRPDEATSRKTLLVYINWLRTYMNNLKDFEPRVANASGSSIFKLVKRKYDEWKAIGDFFESAMARPKAPAPTKQQIDKFLRLQDNVTHLLRLVDDGAIG
jgi:hypothetical protein